MHKRLDQQILLENKPAEVEFRLVSEESDVRSWWLLHQDAFSDHFGFAPRDYEAWKKLVLQSPTFDPQNCFIAFQNGEACGFIELANANYHLNGGYVNTLGVAKAFQGRRIGRALLQHAIARSAEAGREFIELNVDTGNTTGALRLYESLGFEVKSAWEQYENKDWPSVANSL